MDLIVDRVGEVVESVVRLRLIGWSWRVARKNPRLTVSYMSIRLRLEHLVPEAIDALGDLIRTGPPRERVAAAREVLAWVYGDRETTRHVDIQLCAVAPEALTLDQIREEAERRRLESLGQRPQVLMSDSNYYRTPETEQKKLKTSDDLFDAIAQIKPDSNPQ